MGNSWAQFQRIVYAKKCQKNARLETQATKELALSSFPRYKSFETIVPTKCYAVALKTNISRSSVVVPTFKNSYKNQGYKNSAKYSVKVLTSTVSLHNKFQCLQDLCESQNDVI